MQEQASYLGGQGELELGITELRFSKKGTMLTIRLERVLTIPRSEITSFAATDTPSELQVVTRKGTSTFVVANVEAWLRALAWKPTFPLIRRVDDVWYQVERLVCAVMFIAMGLMVFASVVTEIFGRRGDWSYVAVLFVVCVMAVRTRAVKEGEVRSAWPVSLAIAVGLTAGISGAVYLYSSEYPGGFIWAQKLALVMMIWVALLGASMATYDRSHLALEMGEKIWPTPALRFVKSIAHALTAVFCVAAAYLSIELIFAQRREHGTIPGAEWLPTWVAFLAMPYAFTAMAIRYFAQAGTVVSRTAAPAEEQLPS